MQAELSDKKKVVENTKAEQSKVLKETKNQEKTFQQILKDKLAQKAAFEKEIFEFEKLNVNYKCKIWLYSEVL